jgi:cholest-4-en-3-one 26-monooxygenase
LSTPAVPKGFDPTDPDIYEQRVPHAEFAELRKTAPVWYVEQTPDECAGFDDGGYWAVSRHEDVREVSRNSHDFSTYENTAIIRFAPDMTREQLDAQRVILINQDPPDHTQLRGIISRGFTPRAIGALHDNLRERAERIVHEAVEKGSGNFVEDVAAELPLQAIAELLGVPQEDRGKIFEWSNQMVAYDDPEYSIDPESASVELLGYFMAMAEDRKASPRDDIVTKLVQADVDGHALTSDEFGFFVLLLAVAGNETTRNAITHGMNAFFDNPDQWELFKDTRPNTAVDEIVRWATPVSAFQRTALRDVQVGGVDVAQGQRVGLFYASANYDTAVFDRPHTFDISRSPNPHLAFGGNGAHFCIGASLARLEIKLIFEALAEHAPDISKAGDPRRLRSGWLNGIKELQVSYK